MLFTLATTTPSVSSAANDAAGTAVARMAAAAAMTFFTAEALTCHLPPPVVVVDSPVEVALLLLLVPSLAEATTEVSALRDTPPSSSLGASLALLGVSSCFDLAFFFFCLAAFGFQKNPMSVSF